ncbi:uncharacterized protein [Argopecten irradians]|uniref:uncharacterized protein n=1 Tax=Argopecten irradians TaxID=31199 RepID=UPI003713BAC3
MCRLLWLILAVIVTRVGTYHVALKPEVNSALDHIDQILKIHNGYRRMVGAADMRELVWSDSLADKAFTTVQSCTSNGRPVIGQNMYYQEFSRQSNSVMVSKAIDSWYAEKKSWERYPRCAEACQYTQVVWATTRKIGCAFKKCNNLFMAEELAVDAWYLICLYDERGNDGIHLPFRRGKACSLCSPKDTCRHNLCSSNATGTTTPHQTTTSNPNVKTTKPVTKITDADFWKRVHQKAYEQSIKQTTANVKTDISTQSTTLKRQSTEGHYGFFNPITPPLPAGQRTEHVKIHRHTPVTSPVTIRNTEDLNRDNRRYIPVSHPPSANQNSRYMSSTVKTFHHHSGYNKQRKVKDINNTFGSHIDKLNMQQTEYLPRHHAVSTPTQQTFDQLNIHPINDGVHPHQSQDYQATQYYNNRYEFNRDVPSTDHSVPSQQPTRADPRLTSPTGLEMAPGLDPVADQGLSTRLGGATGDISFFMPGPTAITQFNENGFNQQRSNGYPRNVNTNIPGQSRFNKNRRKANKQPSNQNQFSKRSKTNQNRNKSDVKSFQSSSGKNNKWKNEQSNRPNGNKSKPNRFVPFSELNSKAQNSGTDPNRVVVPHESENSKFSLSLDGGKKNFVFKGLPEEISNKTLNFSRGDAQPFGTQQANNVNNVMKNNYQNSYTTPITTTTERIREICVDTDPNCPGWTVYCKDNIHVFENCRKTCGTCTVPFPPDTVTMSSNYGRAAIASQPNQGAWRGVQTTTTKTTTHRLANLWIEFPSNTTTAPTTNATTTVMPLTTTAAWPANPTGTTPGQQWNNNAGVGLTTTARTWASQNNQQGYPQTQPPYQYNQQQSGYQGTNQQQPSYQQSPTQVPSNYNVPPQQNTQNQRQSQQQSSRPQSSNQQNQPQWQQEKRPSSQQNQNQWTQPQQGQQQQTQQQQQNQQMQQQRQQNQQQRRQPQQRQQNRQKNQQQQRQPQQMQQNQQQRQQQRQPQQRQQNQQQNRNSMNGNQQQIQHINIPMQNQQNSNSPQKPIRGGGRQWGNRRQQPGNGRLRKNRPRRPNRHRNNKDKNILTNYSPWGPAGKNNGKGFLPAPPTTTQKPTTTTGGWVTLDAKKLLVKDKKQLIPQAGKVSTVAPPSSASSTQQSPPNKPPHHPSEPPPHPQAPHQPPPHPHPQAPHQPPPHPHPQAPYQPPPQPFHPSSAPDPYHPSPYDPMYPQPAPHHSPYYEPDPFNFGMQSFLPPSFPPSSPSTPSPTPPPTRPTTPPPTPPIDPFFSTCSDADAQCPTWTSYCGHNQYVDINCDYSCGRCNNLFF